ncbi:hypothetical protein GIB67_035961 [Kingdonia uniflora]|uniref:Cysteine-rich receptor-like protein kinase 2 n=1 Tax=Kingdonia uniflora TaxID=39325 RepID=A0A7J7N160_9MAGN|nr:hypothetical protein GIB67_035961 [Kingdonia uniflora]
MKILQSLTLIFIIVVVVVNNIVVVIGDPQINLLNKGCSQYKATNPSIFLQNLDSALSDLRINLKNASWFATAQKVRSAEPVYALAQCRSYLTTSDCVACFDTAEAQIRNCSGGGANGARVIYDGCFLRIRENRKTERIGFMFERKDEFFQWYESNEFYDQTTLPGNVGVCGNKTVSQGTIFNEAVDKLLGDLLVATPRIHGFFAVAKRDIVNGGGTVLYGVGQCAETVTESGCKDCLTVAYSNIESCPPDADGRAVDAGCFLRYSDTSFFNNNQTTDLTPFLKQGNSSNKKAIIGGICGGVALILLLVVFGLYLLLRRKPKKGRKGDILGATELRGPVNFGFKDLKTATKNFSEENKLGEGGFGDVYKGILANGKTVAIKKLAITQSNRAKADFESEVKLISNVHHRNLIRLLGCCSKRQELLLVYEYMANCSLDKFLFGDKRGSLNWKQRLNIIIGTARGLAYLHEDFHVCIIHRDIKCSNILLDDEFQPKIADFGLARLLPEDQSHLSTKFAGTLGYTAPEYAIHGQLSTKVDTYAYGIVVLEIISGRKSNDVKLEPVTQYLLQWAWRLYEDDMLLDLVDESLDINGDEVKRVIEIALSCTQSSVVSRPTMSEIVVLLLSNGSLEDKPTRPTFIESANKIRPDTSTSSGSSMSNATVSITQTSGR